MLRIAHDVDSRWLPKTQVAVRSRLIHGYKRVFRVAGEGPPLLLIHGIGDSSRTWDEIMPTLARNHLVIAPDLLGHGASDKPRADYSVAAYANGMRDLLSVLNVERATVIGHSFGGGVAMQFAYQFPERTERLVLIGSGGAGRSVSPLLRAATLPGASLVTSALRLPGSRAAVDLAVELLRLLDTGAGLDAYEIRRIVDDLPNRTARGAFFRTLRSVVDWRGQVITALDRSYLTRDMPVMLVWGERDSVVPVGHARQAHAAMPGSRLEIFDGAGHFPFRSNPARFVGLLEDFCASTPASSWSAERWHELLSLGRFGSPGEDPSAVAPAVREECERSAT